MRVGPVSRESLTFGKVYQTFFETKKGHLPGGAIEFHTISHTERENFFIDGVFCPGVNRPFLRVDFHNDAQRWRLWTANTNDSLFEIAKLELNHDEYIERYHTAPKDREDAEALKDPEIVVDESGFPVEGPKTKDLLNNLVLDAQTLLARFKNSKESQPPKRERGHLRIAA